MDLGNGEFSMMNSQEPCEVAKKGTGKIKRRKKRLYRTDLDHPIGTVERRNQRERFRVHSLNSTFRVLEAMLPSPRKFGKVTKPSKADVLRSAIIYIESLQCLINGGEPTSREIKAIHERITPHKGRVVLPALEQACTTYNHIQKSEEERTRSVRRALCLEGSRLIDPGVGSYSGMNEINPAVSYHSWWDNATYSCYNGDSGVKTNVSCQYEFRNGVADEMGHDNTENFVPLNTFLNHQNLSVVQTGEATFADRHVI